MSSLGHVRWLGGGSGAGKTTIASLLASQLGLRVYSTDQAIAAHSSEPSTAAPLLDRFLAMGLDERWLTRDPETMAETFPWFAGERFDLIIRDLQQAPITPLTLAEGFRLLPRLVHPLMAERWHGVWLVPAPAFRRSALLQRPPERQFWLRTSDPPAAPERLLARDAMFAEALTAEAERLQLKVLRVDETRSEPDLVDEVASTLRLT